MAQTASLAALTQGRGATLLALLPLVKPRVDPLILLAFTRLIKYDAGQSLIQRLQL